MSDRPYPPHLLALLRGFLLARFNMRFAPTGDPDAGERFDGYIRGELAPAMKIAAERIEPVGRGTNPIVRKIIDVAGRSHVARCFPRRLAGKEKSREHTDVSRLLAHSGIAVPRVEHCDSSFLTLGRHGFEVVVEEWVEGRHPSADDFRSSDSGIAASLARVMANLHSQSSPSSGTPWRKRERKGDFLGEMFVQRGREALSIVEQSDLITPDSSALDLVRAHLDKCQASLDSGPPYALVHGDVQARNVVVRSAAPGGDASATQAGIVLIDFGTVHYGLWPWDIVGFHNGCARRDIAVTRLFAKAYMALRPEADPEYLRRAWEYLHPFYHVEKCAAALRKYRRAREGRRSDHDPEALARRAQAQWRLAVEAVESGVLPV